MWLIVYSNDYAPLTVRPIYSSSKLRTAQKMIFSLVAMIGLEKCCITSAYLQWICHSGERVVAHGSLVLYPDTVNVLNIWTLYSALFRTKILFNTIMFILPLQVSNCLTVFDLKSEQGQLITCWCLKIAGRKTNSVNPIRYCKMWYLILVSIFLRHVCWNALDKYSINSDTILKYFFSFSRKNRAWYFMLTICMNCQILFSGKKKKKKKFKMSSAEMFWPRVLSINTYHAMGKFSRWQIDIFLRKQALTFQFAFKCQSLFFGKNKRIQNVIWNFYPACKVLK